MTNSISLNPPISFSTQAGVDPTGDSSAMVESLTPDALMTYCQTRLDSIDSQIGSAFTEQEVQSQQTKDLTGVMHAFQAYSSKGVTDKTEVLKLEKSLYDFVTHLKSTDPGSPELANLTQTLNNVLSTGTGPVLNPDPTATDKYIVNYVDKDQFQPNNPNNDGDPALGTDEVSGFVQNMQDSLSHLNSDAQLQMIQVQSLMAQRQTAVTLTTNLVQSLSDQSNKIAANIGH